MKSALILREKNFSQKAKILKKYLGMQKKKFFHGENILRDTRPRKIFEFIFCFISIQFNGVDLTGNFTKIP